MSKQQNKTRVVIFIDYTNAYKRIENINNRNGKDNQWPQYFDPKFLVKNIINGRTLEKVMFYCTKPPGKKLDGNTSDVESYHEQMRYIIKIEGLAGFDVKFGHLKGIPGHYREKGLDTHLSVDMVKMAFKGEYDTAILVANDTDYVPAVNSVKEAGRRVELLFFSNTPCNELKNACDVRIKAKASFFRELSR